MGGGRHAPSCGLNKMGFLLQLGPHSEDQPSLTVHPSAPGAVCFLPLIFLSSKESFMNSFFFPLLVVMGGEFPLE